MWCQCPEKDTGSVPAKWRLSCLRKGGLCRVKSLSVHWMGAVSGNTAFPSAHVPAASSSIIPSRGLCVRDFISQGPQQWSEGCSHYQPEESCLQAFAAQQANLLTGVNSTERFMLRKLPSQAAVFWTSQHCAPRLNFWYHPVVAHEFLSPLPRVKQDNNQAFWNLLSNKYWILCLLCQLPFLPTFFCPGHSATCMAASFPSPKEAFATQGRSINQYLPLPPVYELGHQSVLDGFFFTLEVPILAELEDIREIS